MLTLLVIFLLTMIF